MQELIPFLQNLFLLLIEGTVLGLVLVPTASLSLLISLALPISAFFNAVLFFAYRALGIPLFFAPILIGHLIIITALIFFIYKKPFILMDLERSAHIPKKEKIILSTLFILLISVGLCLSHAMLSAEGSAIGEIQYPSLVNSLFNLANLGEQKWGNAVAHAMLYLLNFSSFSAVFLAIRKQTGLLHNVMVITTLVVALLLIMQTTQDYKNVTMLQYVLLSLACLSLWIKSAHERKYRWLVLAGIFVAASVTSYSA